ncbi:MAG: hypothetical protein PHV16_03950, partial [Candidatus Nanoarchaeia archaeon]|nr:hypothetical protein [Candidatus Nanoarchaeia archaeon]
IVPRYNHVVDTYNALENMGFSLAKNITEEIKDVSALSINIAKSNISKLNELNDIVDLIAVYSLNKTELDKTYKKISSEDLKIKKDFVIYSPTAVKHPGKMSNSGKSDAEYYWIIKRDDPVNGENPVSLLLQFIKPRASTSRHYHIETIEYFLPLFGKTMITCQKITEKLPSKAKELIYDVFSKVMPKTAHQLKTLDEPAVNLLCMQPYDPNLKDHFYK